MRYSLVVPGRSLPAIRSALGNYDRVQARTLDPEAEPTRGRGRRGRVGVWCARSCAWRGRAASRLRTWRSTPTRSRASPGSSPAPTAGGRRSRSIFCPARRARGGGCDAGCCARRAGVRAPAEPTGGLLEVLGGGGRGAGRRPVADVVEQRVLREQLAAKVLQAEPLFALQVLVRCRAPVKALAVERMQALLGCFDAWAAANSLRVVGVRVAGLAFLGSDLPGRRSWFDRRMSSGLFAPARRGLVGAREVAGLLKPPTAHCLAPEVLRLGPAVHPAPAGLPEYTGQPDVVPLGRVTGESGERLVALPLADTFFTYTAGRSRWGKTELAITQFLHLVRAGHGGMFLDPHEDAIQRIKSCLTDQGLAERVVELDLVGARSRDGQPGWNLLAARGLGEDARERRVEAIVDSFASALRWGERNNRALTLTTQAAAALIELSTHLPDGLQPTLFQIPTLLGNPEWRERVLPLLSPARRQFFSERFPRMAEEAITPVTNLIDRLRSSTQLAALLGAQSTSYDIARAMNTGRIVLACPGAGGARDKLIANLLVFDLLHAAKGRATIPPERRRAFYVFLDEVQTYDGAASGNLAALLEQTAKYGIRAFLLNQNPERLTRETLNALTTNRSHLITTALNERAAALIAREWNNDPPASAITSLPAGRSSRRQPTTATPPAPSSSTTSPSPTSTPTRTTPSRSPRSSHSSTRHPAARTRPRRSRRSTPSTSASTTTSQATATTSPAGEQGEAGRSTMPRLPDPEDTQP